MDKTNCEICNKLYSTNVNIINDGKAGWLSGYIESFKIKFKLLKKVDYMYIKENRLYLPSEDMLKDEIKSFVNKNIKGKLFE